MTLVLKKDFKLKCCVLETGLFSIITQVLLLRHHGLLFYARSITLMFSISACCTGTLLRTRHQNLRDFFAFSSSLSSICRYVNQSYIFSCLSRLGLRVVQKCLSWSLVRFVKQNLIGNKVFVLMLIALIAHNWFLLAVISAVGVETAIRINVDPLCTCRQISCRLSQCGQCQTLDCQLIGRHVYLSAR
jgi:hypothetical protein